MSYNYELKLSDSSNLKIILNKIMELEEPASLKGLDEDSREKLVEVLKEISGDS